MLRNENWSLKETKADLERHIAAQEAAVSHFERKVVELGRKYEEQYQEIDDYEKEVGVFYLLFLELL